VSPENAFLAVPYITAETNAAAKAIREYGLSMWLTDKVLGSGRSHDYTRKQTKLCSVLVVGYS
jgi:hypothetical protein